MQPSYNALIFDPVNSFTSKAIEVFQFQYEYNPTYKRFVDAVNCKVDKVNKIEDIPFLPISFFKNLKVATTEFLPQVIFESSGTTGTTPSRHFVKDITVYEESFIKGFEKVYGSIKDYCILGLLPSYLERETSSLVYMVKMMMDISAHPDNGFFLYDHKKLAQKLKTVENAGQKTLLIGVTYALLDFAQAFPMPLSHTIIMETGGMKGRKKEAVRDEVHSILKNAFGLNDIHSEYGMTELLSQAYATADGLFSPPHWMKVLVREEDDPFKVVAHTSEPKTGLINIIDLANIYSCSFIATDDVGKLYSNGHFQVVGRLDNSDIRGCSLLAL